MTFPTAPQKVASFFSAQPPTQSEVGAQFDEFSRSIREILGFLGEIARSDGKIRPESLPESQKPEILAQKLEKTLENGLLSLQSDVLATRGAALDAHAVLDQVQALKNELFRQMSEVSLVREALSARWAFLQEHVFPFLVQRAPRGQIPNPDMPILTGEIAPGVGASPTWETTYSGAPEGVPNVPADTSGDPAYTGVLWPQAGGFYGAGQLDAGASPVAADYAQVSIEWAEHMPDPIPANVLAVTAITGNHWSSRWWAAKTASYFGGMAGWYLGAFDTAHAPTMTATGDPLIVGMMYFNTDQNEMMVWNGHAWQPFGAPAPAMTSSLYYMMTSGQTVITLTTNDWFGQSATLLTGQAVNVYLNGVRLTPVLDYVVAPSTSTITLQAGAPAGVFATIDNMILANQLAPTAVTVKRLGPQTPAFDGTSTSFVLHCADATVINVTDNAELLISLDGVTQEPAIAFTASGNVITFAAAPSADSYFFGIWFS